MLQGCQRLQEFKHIITEKKGEDNNVGLIKLNRPKALNALCDELMREMVQGLDQFENDKAIAVIVITGSERAFAGRIHYPLKFSIQQVLSSIASRLCYIRLSIRHADIQFSFLCIFTLSCLVLIKYIYFLSAGADIREMQNLDCSKVLSGNFLNHWNRLSRCQKPTIAAVNGFAVCFYGLIFILYISLTILGTTVAFQPSAN